MGKIDLTEKERYILRLAAWSGFDPDWRELYVYSREKAYKALPPSLSQIVSNWKNSYIVKDYFTNERERHLRFLDSVRAEAVEDYQKEIAAGELSQNGGTAEAGPKTKKRRINANGDEIINFQDRDEFIGYIERRANEIKDEKLKFEYLKILADLKQYKKDPDDSSKKDIQRFYMPLSCQNCKLYQAQRSKISEDAQK